MKTDMPMHFLAGVQSLAPETRSQDRVPFDNCFPGLAEGGAINLLRQRANHLNYVPAGVARGETVKHQPVLQGRERVALFDAVRWRRFFRARHILGTGYPLTRMGRR